MDVFVSLFVLVMLGLAVAGKVQVKLFTRIGVEWLLLVWFSVVAISYILNGNALAQWAQKLLEFRIWFVFYFAVACLRARPPGNRAIAILCTLFSVSAIYAIAIWFYGQDPLRFLPELTQPRSGRTGGFLSEPMTFAHTHALVLCGIAGLCLALLFPLHPHQPRNLGKDSESEAPTWWSASLLILALVAGLCAIVLSFTRGVWIALLVGFLVMAAYQSRRAVLWMVGGAGVGSALGMFIWPAFRSRILLSFSGSDYDGIRWKLWRANWQIFREHFWWGTGWGENAYLVQATYLFQQVDGRIMKFAHAHNQYLHLAAGTGILGLLCYVAVLVFFLVLNLWVLKQQSEMKWTSWIHRGLGLGALAAQVSFIVGGLTEANFEHSKVRHILILTWAIVVWLAYASGFEKDESSVRKQARAQ